MEPIREVDKNGTVRFKLNGDYHRTDGPAIIYADGSRYWYIKGKLHRTDGPAVIYPNGEEKWYIYGRLHRTDGPAITWSDGGHEWFIRGIVYIGFNSWCHKLNKSDEEIFLLKLKYGITKVWNYFLDLF